MTTLSVPGATPPSGFFVGSSWLPVGKAKKEAQKAANAAAKKQELEEETRRLKPPLLDPIVPPIVSIPPTHT